MDNKTRIAKLKETEYQGLLGIFKPTFDKIFEILKCAYKELYEYGGHPPRLSVLDATSAEQKIFNRILSKFRIRIEHVNRRLKRFKMLQYQYRNKQCKHLLRLFLICGIYNFELGF